MGKGRGFFNMGRASDFIFLMFTVNMLFVCLCVRVCVYEAPNCCQVMLQMMQTKKIIQIIITRILKCTGGSQCRECVCESVRD